MKFWRNNMIVSFPFFSMATTFFRTAPTVDCCRESAAAAATMMFHAERQPALDDKYYIFICWLYSINTARCRRNTRVIMCLAGVKHSGELQIICRSIMDRGHAAAHFEPKICSSPKWLQQQRQAQLHWSTKEMRAITQWWRRNGKVRTEWKLSSEEPAEVLQSGIIKLKSAV